MCDWEEEGISEGAFPVDRVSRDEIVAIASRLISIPSTSGEERAVMEEVVRWCSPLALPFEVIASDHDRPNVVITLGDPAAGPTIVMNGHLDTVPVSDPVAWRTGPYDPTVSDRREETHWSRRVRHEELGRRDASCHGGPEGRAAAGLRAGAHCQRRRNRRGARHHVSAGGDRRRAPARPDYCLIGEKSDLKVRNAERGLLAIDVTCLGRASHTAAARVTGVNAIAKAAKAILALEKDIDRFHPAVGKPVISINTIQAGVAHNVVPGECTFSIDRRLIPGETRESAVAEIVATLDDIASEDPAFRYELISTRARTISQRISPRTSRPWCRRCEPVSRR